MVTKALIESIEPDGYHFKVRIPIFHKIENVIGATPYSELPIASCCIPPGIYPNFSIGDIVWVAFENGQCSDPVILGILYNDKAKKTTSANVDSINVDSIIEPLVIYQDSSTNPTSDPELEPEPEPELDPENVYCVDIVMCIDITGSMKPFITEVKRNALSIHQKIVESMREEDKELKELRIKIIAFGDYGADDEPMKESKFFTLPIQNASFELFVNDLSIGWGGDTPENALEAIALALKSNWTTRGTNRRHIVIVFSDAGALELQSRASSPLYPTGMPANLDELRSWWEGTGELDSTYQPSAGRLVVFAPDTSPWNEMQIWNNYLPAFSDAGTGLSAVTIQSVIDFMVEAF